VIVLEGTGDTFIVPPKGGKLLQDLPPSEDWDLIEGLRRTLSAVISINKPIIAKVNGDAIGYGSSLLYACDFIVASEDALIGDMHLGMGDLPFGNTTWGFVAGDGGAIFVPMHMSLPMAKEYLMLARTWTTRELADRGVINWAVPRAELNAIVLSMCERLIRRPPYALAWTKRVLNQEARQRFNAGYDAGMAFELINVLHKRAEMHRPKEDRP
jgi:enoyl-CoA hydratase